MKKIIVEEGFQTGEVLDHAKEKLKVILNKVMDLSIGKDCSYKITIILEEDIRDD